MVNYIQAGDFLLSCTVLTSGNNYYKIKHLFNLLNLGCVNQSTFFGIQANYICPEIVNFWCASQQKKILDEIRGRKLILLGDGQNDSPGHSAQYLNYNLIDPESGYLVVYDVVDKRQTKLNSNAMEMFGYTRSIKFLEEDKQDIQKIVTDGHIGMKSYMVNFNFP
ncbi:hypothetical protein SNE40_020586 [Patella caerulea]|uniref:Uncharacterized protein n=1 Tax=Patella caerulea TaxID=87958 RepID=A0AAN8J4U9_PATCE